MAKTPLRIAIIGLGFMGRNHLRVYQRLEGVRIVAVADTDAALLHEAIRGTPIQPYPDYRSLLTREKVDLVSIAVPTRLHLEVALAAVESRCHILVEKPISSTVSDAREMQRQARSAGVNLSVGHVERFNPAVTTLKEHLTSQQTSQDIGKIIQIQSRRVGPFQPRVRDVGVVHDLASHDLDILRLLIGNEPTRLYAQTQVGTKTKYEDSLLGLLSFGKGIDAFLDINWLSPWKERRLTMLGEMGAYRLNYLTQELSVHGQDGEREIPVERKEPLEAELEAVTRSIREGSPPPVSAADAIAALRLAELLVDSGRNGQPIDVVQQDD